MPTDVQTIILFWNKALVAEAGLDAENGPQTWEEFFDWARKLTKRDGDALVQSGWGGKGYVPELLSFIEQKGGKFYDEATGQFVFADDATALDAIREYASLYKDDKVYDTEFVKNWAGFRQGLIGMMLGHPAMIGNLPQTAPDLDFGVGMIPANGDSRATCVTSWGYVASAKAPSAEAIRFIEFLSSEEVEKKWTQKTGEPVSYTHLKEVISVPSDENGILVEKLEQRGANVVYVMPSHQYPTGRVMPIGRRAELLNWAAKDRGRYVIEDDYDSEFRYSCLLYTSYCIIGCV